MLILSNLSVLNTHLDKILSCGIGKPTICIGENKGTDQLHGYREAISTFVFATRIVELGDNCIQIFHLGRYIVGYTVGNFVLRRRVSGAVKHDFRPYIRRYTTPNEKFEYCYPHSNVLFNYKHRKMLCFSRNVSVTSDV